jgi:hypothetical protein
MTRTWLPVFLFACTWALTANGELASHWLAWPALVLAGTWLLGKGDRHLFLDEAARKASQSPACGTRLSTPRSRDAAIALAMLLPVVWLAPWPDRSGPLLLAVGMGLCLLPAATGSRAVRLWQACVVSGVILLAQSLAVRLYAAATAREHDLPGLLVSLLGAIAQLLGFDAAVDGSTLAFRELNGVHRLAATWELLVDPATIAFLVGGLVLLGLWTYGELPAGQRGPTWLRRAGLLAACVAAWLPFRAAILIALYAHRAALGESGARPHAMDQFLGPWLHLLLLAAPVLLARRFVAMPESSESSEREGSTEEASEGFRRRLAAIAMVVAGVAALILAWLWEPIGQRKEGRVLVVERHSQWEPTAPAYDTSRFGEEASYTYAAVYDYCSRFYEMSRLLETEAIDADRLEGCDVLVIKIPTAPYSPQELAAVERFVERGGGLLLIGEHTDYKKSTSYLNDIARPFGFRFRKDLLFAVGDPYVQRYRPARGAPPAVQNVPPMWFAVSSSIAPGWSWGTAAVRGEGLWSLPPAYEQAANYFPEPEYRPEMRYGSFVQLWATRHGQGRVLAWTDSTIFSNFCTFEPGKCEMLLGMLEWLNRRSAWDSPSLRWLLRAALAALAAGLLFGAWRVGRPRGLHFAVVIAAVCLGGTVSSAAIASAQRALLPPPGPARPMVEVAIDRTVSDVPLSRNGFTRLDGRGYGLFEQWIPRLGCYAARRSGTEAFTGDALVILCPRKSVPEEYRQGLADYVASGGRLLVIDSPEGEGTTANSLLWPFGLTVSPGKSRSGKLQVPAGWPAVEATGACQIGGGTPLVRIDGMPVAAEVAYGQGTVIAVGFGSLFNDAALGQSYSLQPKEVERSRSELLFALLRRLLDGTSLRR